MDKVSKELIGKVGKKLKVEGGVLKRVSVVECGNGEGFLGCGRGEIVLEGDVMWKYLKIKVDGEGKRRYLQDVGKRNGWLVYEKWRKELQLGGEGEWKRVEGGGKIDEKCGNLGSCWGLGEIMGLNQ